MYDPEHKKESIGSRVSQGGSAVSSHCPALDQLRSGAMWADDGTGNAAPAQRTPSAKAAATQVMSHWADAPHGLAHRKASPDGAASAPHALQSHCPGHEHDLSKVSVLSDWFHPPGAGAAPKTEKAAPNRKPAASRPTGSHSVTIGKTAAHDGSVDPKSGAAPVKTPAGAPGAGGGDDTLRHYIEVNEGRRNHVYIDTKGHPTVGIGFNLDRGNARAAMQSVGADYDAVRAGSVNLTDEQINQLFTHDVATAIADARSVIGSGTFDGLSEGRRIVVIDMVFNLGKAGLGNFHKAILAMQQGNYEEAAQQMIDSAWYKQVGDRARRNVELMRSGGGAGGPSAGGAQQPATGGAAPSSGPQRTPRSAAHSPTSWQPAPTLLEVRSGHAALHTGEEGPAVAEVQRLLHLSADGRFGPATERAVKAFQSRNHLTADGIIGRASIQRLESQPGAPPGGGASHHHGTTSVGASEPGVSHGLGTVGASATNGHSAEVPGFADIEKDFHAGIPGGGGFTWHDALYLPSWKRHASASEVSAQILDNIARQAQALSKLAQHFGKKINIHCWLRPTKYNQHIGGASNSAHLRGTATDFDISGLTAEHVRKEIFANPGLYPGAGELRVSWLHLDLEHTTWFGK